ncbi:MAG TPA: PilN domain-containing protein [Thermoanaerobaculia bacterium]|nr:PilN domain-containing protein [Thermoanaerobaculia bacterium]HUM30471.1 PilN domain-containing protein [Thermoanaerobaculia bacterium]HXK68662.1 PilN domain-containing protein [Thermoanaerobaculia bacterium]
MIKINLLPEAQQPTRRFEAVSVGKGDNLANIALISLIVVGLLVSGFRWWTLNSEKKNLNLRIKEAEAELERLKPILEEVERFKKRKDLLQKKLDLIQDLKANQKGPVHIMDEISQKVPEYLWFDQLELKSNTITIRGGALNPNEVAEFLKNVDDSPYFSEPTLKEIREQKEYYTFSCNFGFTFNPAKASEGQKEVGNGS